jgi:hypothetical protein
MTASATLPLDQIRDLAANYSDRQGLRIVPIALMLMAQTLPSYRTPPALFGIDTILLTLIVGLGGYFLIGRYYTRRFGRVEEMPYEGVPIAGQILLVVLCFFVSVAIDLGMTPPVFVSGLLIAGWLIVTAWPSRHIRGQYLSMGILLAIISWAPLVGQKQPDVAASYAFVFGTMLLLAGVRDHMQFVRLFPRMETQHD